MAIPIISASIMVMANTQALSLTLSQNALAWGEFLTNSATRAVLLIKIVPLTYSVSLANVAEPITLLVLSVPPDQMRVLTGLVTNIVPIIKSVVMAILVGGTDAAYLKT
jgi:hypothetical protein